MPSDSKEPETEDPSKPEEAVREPEVADRTPHGSALSVKSETGGTMEDAPTLEGRGRLPQVTLQTSRESSLQPQDVSYDVGSAPNMASSSLAVAMETAPSTTRQKQRSCRCCTCTGCGPQDGGRILSTMYCILVSLLATVLPINEGLNNSWLTEIPVVVFLGYLYGVSILFVIFVEIYLLRRAKRRRSRRRNRNGREADDISQDGEKSVDSGGKNNLAYTSQQTLNGTPNANGKAGMEMGEDYMDSDTKSVKSEGEMSTMTELFLGDSDPDLDGPLPHRISLFHRIAMAVFALGFMIYLGLLLKQLHERHSPAACSATSAVWPHYVQLAFLLFQTFFIFKHAQVSLRSWQPLFRLGFVHMTATNWSVIVRAIVWETLETDLKHKVDVSRNISNVTNVPTLDTSAYAQCYVDEDILYKASPYLYPFILQYSLLAIAATYSFYADVGACPVKEEPEKDVEIERSEAERRRRLSYSQAPAVNFHKTHRGLFFGLVIMGATFVSIIVFFSYLGNEGQGNKTLSVLIYYSSDMAIQAILIFVVWIGWLHVKRLSFVWPPLGVSVDEVLIIIALIGSILHRLFRIISTFKYLLTGEANTNIFIIFTDLILGVGLNLLQTSFVMDCFSRRSTTRRHLKRKPGRGSITFLLVANLALWAFRMFQLRQVQSEGTAIDQLAYGIIVWELIQRSCIPLSIYYHYQVSASLARVWTDAYKKETVRESLRREAEDQADYIMKSRSMDLHFLPRPSPIMRMIELRRRFRKRDEPEVDNETVWSPVSDV